MTREELAELRAHNRAAMPETAEIMARLRAEFADLGPISLVYATEGGYEVGERCEVVAEGKTWVGSGYITVQKVKLLPIGPKAVKTRWRD